MTIKGFDGAKSGIVVGFLGGTIGGFTAFPGAAVVVWTGLRNLSKRLTRSIVQPYILVLQIVSLGTNAYLHPEISASRFWILLCDHDARGAARDKLGVFFCIAASRM